MSHGLKRPSTAFAGPLQRRKRVEVPNHLEFIRVLPCLVCGLENRSEAAHIKMSDRRVAKRETGGQEKSSDCWTVPLCSSCHREGPTSQHGMGERDFWELLRIDVILVALALWQATNDYDRACQIIRTNGKLES